MKDRTEQNAVPAQHLSLILPSCHLAISLSPPVYVACSCHGPNDIATFIAFGAATTCMTSLLLHLCFNTAITSRIVERLPRSLFYYSYPTTPHHLPVPATCKYYTAVIDSPLANADLSLPAYQAGRRRRACAAVIAPCCDVSKQPLPYVRMPLLP